MNSNQDIVPQPVQVLKQKSKVAPALIVALLSVLCFVLPSSIANLFMMKAIISYALYAIIGLSGQIMALAVATISIIMAFTANKKQLSGTAGIAAGISTVIIIRIFAAMANAFLQIFL